MSQNYSETLPEVSDNPDGVKVGHKWWMALIIPAWVFVSFFAAEALVVVLVWFLSVLHVPIGSINKVVFSASIDAFLYLVTLVIAIGVPWLIKKYQTSRIDIGLTRFPSWADILIVPAGLIVYIILSALLILLATHILPGFDVNQVQDTGFKQLSERYEYILAFITLIIIAPIAEETLFRGYLYGKLKKFVPVWVAILVTSALFGALHGAWNLAIDTFALSVILCLLRESTGNLWASILLHMTKNGIAFYFLFINPMLLSTLGR